MTKKLYTSVSERLIGALWNQGDLTQKQLKKMYKVGSPSKEVQRLREMGIPVYSVITKDKKGKRIVKYRLDEGSPEIIATAYRTEPSLFVLTED